MTEKKGKTSKFKKPANGREAALVTLFQVWEEGGYATLVLQKNLQNAGLEEMDRRFATELVNGAVKAKGTLDFLVQQLVNRPLQKLEPIVRYILHLGLYQIFYLERIPDSAACNESVKLAKKYSHKGSDKFVNGVLRNSVRQKEALWEKVQSDPALKYCHPQWLIERWTALLGSEETLALCEWNNYPAYLSLRLQPTATTRDAFLQDLREMGAEAEVSAWCPDGVIIIRSPGVTALLAKFPHSFYIQDESSMLPAQVLQPRPGEKVLDMCAAPGGKTAHMTALMEDKGEIVACDIYPHKLKLIQENAARLELKMIQTVLQDGAKFRSDWGNRFDRVLVDAPCSGLGVLRRRAEARWTKTPESLASFPALQKAILDNGARYVKPGGFLLYSTCTIEPAENQLQIADFLKRHPDWQLAGFPHPRTGERVKELQLYPQRDGIDGFYLALLQKPEKHEDMNRKVPKIDR